MYKALEDRVRDEAATLEAEKLRQQAAADEPVVW
jgi:hypothetical protein